MTDNAFAYRILKRGQDVLRAAPRAKHKFIGPHCPCKPARSSASTAPWRQTGRPPDIHWHRLTQHRFCPWLKHYNTVRRCSTLGTTVLISRLFINLVARYI
jgi:hypothetical protein